MDRATALRILGLGESAAPTAQEIEGAYWRLRAHVERRSEEAPSGGERAARQAELGSLQQALQAALTLGTSPVPASPPETSSPAPANRWLIGWAVAATLLLVVAVVLLMLRLTSGVQVGGSRSRIEVAGASGSATVGGDANAAAADSAPAAGAEPAAVAPGPAGTPAEADAAPGATGESERASPGVAGLPESASAQAAGEALDPAQLVAKANLEGSQLQIVRSADSANIAEGPADDSVYSLPPGRYILQVANPECADLWVSEIVLEPGESKRVTPVNCERNGWIVVRSNVSGDQVSIDSRAAGQSGPRKHAVSVGEHRVLVQKDGYVPWEGVVRIAAAELVTLRAQLYEEADLPEQRSNGAESEAERSEKERTRRQQAQWHDDTERWLLSRYDRNLSGKIDTPSEASSIPCKDWLDIEGTYDRAELGVAMTRLYGFDGSAWVEGALGFDRSVRDVAYKRMKECGLR